MELALASAYNIRCFGFDLKDPWPWPRTCRPQTHLCKCVVDTHLHANTKFSHLLTYLLIKCVNSPERMIKHKQTFDNAVSRMLSPVVVMVTDKTTIKQILQFTVSTPHHNHVHNSQYSELLFFLLVLIVISVLILFPEDQFVVE